MPTISSRNRKELSSVSGVGKFWSNHPHAATASHWEGVRSFFSEWVAPRVGRGFTNFKTVGTGGAGVRQIMEIVLESRGIRIFPHQNELEDLEPFRAGSPNQSSKVTITAKVSCCSLSR